MFKIVKEKLEEKENWNGRIRSINKKTCELDLENKVSWYKQTKKELEEKLLKKTEKKNLLNSTSPIHWHLVFSISRKKMSEISARVLD